MDSAWYLEQARICSTVSAGERNIVGLRLDRVAANEAPEAVGTQVALTAAPDRLRIGGDRDQLLDVIAPAAIVIGDEQQAHPPGSAIRVVEQRQAGKMDGAAAREVDVRLAAARRQALAFDVVADPVERQAQALLAARLDPGDDDEPVRGNGTSAVNLYITPHNRRFACHELLSDILNGAHGVEGVLGGKLDNMD